MLELQGEEQTRESLGLAPTRWIEALSEQDYAFAPESGMYESLVDVGQDVSAGQPLGALHYPERPDREPFILEAHADGILVAHRGPAMTAQGDLLVCLAHDVAPEVLKTF
ncbi:MAG: succinylglutamate desuccinylase/aspartoacylase family protein [Planctomycetaceae bacterium]